MPDCHQTIHSDELSISAVGTVTSLDTKLHCLDVNRQSQCSISVNSCWDCGFFLQTKQSCVRSKSDECGFGYEHWSCYHRLLLSVGSQWVTLSTLTAVFDNILISLMNPEVLLDSCFMFKNRDLGFQSVNSIRNCLKCFLSMSG